MKNEFSALVRCSLKRAVPKGKDKPFRAWLSQRRMKTDNPSQKSNTDRGEYPMIRKYPEMLSSVNGVMSVHGHRHSLLSMWFPSVLLFLCIVQVIAILEALCISFRVFIM